MSEAIVQAGLPPPDIGEDSWHETMRSRLRVARRPGMPSVGTPIPSAKREQWIISWLAFPRGLFREVLLADIGDLCLVSALTLGSLRRRHRRLELISRCVGPFLRRLRRFRAERPAASQRVPEIAAADASTTGHVLTVGQRRPQSLQAELDDPTRELLGDLLGRLIGPELDGLVMDISGDVDGF